jgi:TetR/AcrR family transcriptional regulator, cholesterol catabolism regulator
MPAKTTAVSPEDSRRGVGDNTEPVGEETGDSGRQAILDVVIELLNSDGYGGVQLRTVAKRARVGLDTIYRFFPGRDELIFQAVARWMNLNGYSELEAPADDVSLYDGLMALFRHIFEPWERNPRMLEAYYRARSAPGGQRLDSQGITVLTPVSLALFARADRQYADDVRVLLRNVTYAALGRFVHGDLEITGILPLIERAVRRLTADNAHLANRDAGRTGRNPGPR